MGGHKTDMLGFVLNSSLKRENPDLVWGLGPSQKNPEP